MHSSLFGFSNHVNDLSGYDKITTINSETDDRDEDRMILDRSKAIPNTK